MTENLYHFYIDYCPYEQALSTLQALNNERYLTAIELAETIGEDFRSEVRKRLVLLGIAEEKEANNTLAYVLTHIGYKLKEISYFDSELLPDLFHYLHLLYVPADMNSPKMLWSYSQCSSYFWNSGELSNYKEISSFVQNRMKDDFPALDFTASVGARFDHYAVGRWASYIKNLIPSPVGENKRLEKRSLSRYELILLAITHLYYSRNFRFGDPVVVGANVLDEISSVFFLDPECAKQLIIIASRLSPLLSKRDTYGGMAITLNEPYTIERI